MFRPAEVSLARALKDLVDRALLACLDTIIQVFKVPAQPAAQGPAHTGLARAHEADQKDGAYFGWTCQSFCLRLPADRKSTRLNSSHLVISYAVFCLKKKKTQPRNTYVL